MGRWDVVLPFLAPGRGATPPRSQREPAGSRSVSPQSSTSSQAQLPDVEDIYDLLTSDLVDLEEKLASQGSLNPKEEKLHKLIKVELGERRGVEEIGLALLGGRFSLDAVPGLGSKQPGLGSPHLSSKQEAEPEVWTLPDAPSPASSRSSLFRTATSPQGPSRPSTLSTRTPSAPSAPSSGSRPFKPTPVDFDFVIGNSSVKRGPGRPRPKPEKTQEKEKRSTSRSKRPKAEAPKTSKDAKGSAPKKKSQSHQSQSTLSAKVPKDRPMQDTVPEGYPMQPDAPTESASPCNDDSTPGEVETTAAPAGEPGGTSILDDTADVRKDSTLGLQADDLLDTVCVAHDAPSAIDPGESQKLRATHDGSNDWAEQEQVMMQPEDTGALSTEPAGSDFLVQPVQKEDDIDCVASFEPGAESVREFEPPGTAKSSDSDDGRERLDNGSEDLEVDAACVFDHSSVSRRQTASTQEDAADIMDAKKCPAGSDSLASTPVASPDRPSSPASPVEKSEEAFEGAACQDSTTPALNIEMDAMDAMDGMGGSCEEYPAYPAYPALATAISSRHADAPSSDVAASDVAPSPEVSGPVEKKTKTPRPRKPPLPHDALKALQAKSTVARSNELDYLGLDPGLVERGEIKNYQECFGSFVDIFSWSQSNSDAAQKERCLREALQIFTQFCNIIGSLESQFTTKLPAEHTTPSATHQALNAMASRGAGLYGLFLKGIIDKMDAVPRPVPDSQIQHDVYSLRYYKVVQNRTEVYDIVTRVFHRKEGWEELPHGLGLSNAWNLCWTWSKPKLDYSRLCVWQKVNHFQDNKHLTRKDCLKRCIDRYTRTGSKVAQLFNICPKTFVLPKEYCAFIECFTRIAEENGDLEGGTASKPSKPKVPNMWIMKPAGSSRGRGIQVVNDVGAVHYGELTIIQQYISDPYLLGGFKWDMRTYVTVTSFNPLEAFVYKDGFARFTTVPYNTSEEDIDNKFVHLTNSSIQRHNEDNFMQDEDSDMLRREDAILGGTKISFSMLQQRLKAIGIDWAMVWTKMVDVILKSLCMAEDHIPHQVNAFELFGYDLMMDSKMKVWLIEVNSSPSMGQEHLLDEHVKQPLINDTIDLVEPMEFDRRSFAEVLHRRVEKKSATGSAAGRQQLDLDLHAILKGQVPRKYGEMPKKMGNYERIAPSEAWDNMVKSRSLLFNRVSPN